MVVDPVCGMEINEKTCEYKSDYKGKTYYFCAPRCVLDFEKDPERYLSKSKEGRGDKESSHGHC